MSEVLSQSQIDFLLDSLKGGDSDSKTEEKKPEVKYRKYDFYSPKKFTKDKLRILRDVFEKYARIVISQINSLFRLSCELEIAVIEEQRYYEFSNALRDTDILTSVAVQLQDTWQVKPMLMHITTPLMLTFMDRMMGGSGANTDVDADYSYTDIERALYKTIMNYMIESLKDSWVNYVDLLFEFEAIEDTPTMLQSIGLDETVVIVTLEARAGDAQGRISICFSGDLLTDVFTIFDKKTNKEKSINYIDSTEDIMHNIRNTELNVSAKLGTVEVMMEDIYNLHVGDVINLNKPRDGDIEIEVENLPWFTGRLGQQNNKMAVLIENISDMEEPEKHAVGAENSADHTGSHE